MLKLVAATVAVLQVLTISCVRAEEISNDLFPGPKEYGNVFITTGLGKVRGTYLTSSSGRIFYAFRGIRYAKPPLGDLRFKAPEPLNQWNEIFDATKDGPMCPQSAVNLSDVSEDCLRINIYSHALPTEENGDVRKPVIVYLHQGGFHSLSGQMCNLAGPKYLMDRNIVLVTVNYRLGALGFLATGTPEAPGNAGLKDQVMALKWIKLHIARFGGNPNSVTLLGYGSGASSITLHMVSPMSKNLFHKAIVMSGSATGQGDISMNRLQTAKYQAQFLNCTDATLREMMDCLMTKTAIDFSKTFEQTSRLDDGVLESFQPVVEPDLGQERFLTENPTVLYQKGRFMRIPIIAGLTKDEVVNPAIDILRNSSLRSQLDSEFDILAPIKFFYEKNSRRSNDISSHLREFYLGDNPLSLNKSLDGLAKLYSDAIVGFPMYRFVHLAARYVRVYQYRFSYQGRFSHTYYPIDDSPYGVVHHDDLLYLFSGKSVAPEFTENDPERIVVERLTRMWASFAYRGNPNKPGDEYLRRTYWRTFNLNREQYLDIDKNLEMRQHLYSDRYDVWRELFPLQSQTGNRDRRGSFYDSSSEESHEQHSHSSEGRHRGRHNTSQGTPEERVKRGIFHDSGSSSSEESHEHHSHDHSTKAPHHNHHNKMQSESATAGRTKRDILHNSSSSEESQEHHPQPHSSEKKHHAPHHNKKY